MVASEAYIQRLIGTQSQLYAYILTLLADTAVVDDVLQETNLVLCRKAGEFTEGTSFEAWAFRIARFQCLAYWKLRSRDRLVFDDAALEVLASRAEQQLSAIADPGSALRACLQQLSPKQRELLEGRYAMGGSVKGLSAQLGRSEASISTTLYRIRNLLLDCVRARLAQERAGA